MSTPGWYPDPGGSPGRFRYWDGAHWSSQTTTDPRATPAPTAPEAQRLQRSGTDRGWLLALGILLAVTLIAVVAFVVWGTRNPLGGAPATEDTNSSTPTVSGWDETSTPTPPPPTNSGGTMVACPRTKHTGATRQQSGTLTADTLRSNSLPGWDNVGFSLDFTYDAHWQTKDIYRATFGTHGWMSNIGVALLSNDDGFVDTATSAEQIVECMATSDYYQGFLSRTDLLNEQTDINGHPAWHITTDIRVDDPTLPSWIKGDIVDVFVVDLGGGKDHLGLFLSCYTIDDTTVQQQVQGVIDSLTVIG